MNQATPSEAQRNWSDAVQAVEETAKLFETLRTLVLGSPDGTVSPQAARQVMAATRLLMTELCPGVLLNQRPRDPLVAKVRNQRKALRGVLNKLADLRYGIEHREDLEELGSLRAKTVQARNWAKAANEAHNETRYELRTVKTALAELVKALGDVHGDLPPAVYAALEKTRAC